MAASLLCNQVILFLVERYTEDGEGNGTPLQYSCLENPMDRGAWWATVHGVVKSQTRLRKCRYTPIHTHVCSCLLWRNVYLDPRPFSFDFFFILSCMNCLFWKLIPCQLLRLQIFCPILRVVFLFTGSFCRLFFRTDTLIIKIFKSYKVLNVWNFLVISC